jgi:hypothetical protein
MADMSHPHYIGQMTTLRTRFGLALATALLLWPAQAPAELPSTGTRAVPTYESVGLYWSSPGASVGAAGCEVKFKRSADSTWRQGLNLWYDARNNECRGSLVYLIPDTAYQVELNLPGSAPTRALTFRTWPSRPPVSLTVPVPSGITTLNITAGGSPTGYVVYEGVSGAVLDAQNLLPYNVTINASYVILRNLTLRGAQQDAVRISPNVTDVIIEDNEMTLWGRQRSGSWGVEQDSAVHAVCSTPTLQRVTVQRNRIHEPRYGANSWSDGHPEGPQAVTLFNCGGNHVIRHNEIYSTPGHYYNDIIGGGANESGAGFPNADSDIYGNKLSHSWDDAIEAEGADTNVRIWGNYMDRTGTGIATTPATNGPIYLFRNVYNRSRLLEKVPPDQDDRQVMFKSGSDPARGSGRRYVFHNTTLQATEPGSVYGLGASGGIWGTGASTPLTNTVSRNNIFHNWRTWSAYGEVVAGNDFGWDLFNGSAGAPVTNAIVATPTYAPGHGWQSESGGNYQLAPGTPGYDQGTRIANFNDGYTGAAPDVGADEGGTPPMRFGLEAALPPVGTPDAPRLTNISTRGRVQTGNDVMIAGFIISGSTSKTVVINVAGPSLAPYGIANPLLNPTLTVVRSSDSVVMGTNDDWQNQPPATVSMIQASGFQPNHAQEPALILALAPGAYTAIVSGVNNTTGVGLVGLFEVDHPDAPLINISTRGQVQAGNDVMIAGFIVGGASARTVVINVAGPSLANYGIADPLLNPQLTLVRASDQATLAVNDNWQVQTNPGDAVAIQNSGFQPNNPLEPAIIATLPPGAYTAIVSGVGNTTGVGLVGVFAVP